MLLAHVALAANFHYPNFNDTSGLRLNGDATTSSCDDGGPYLYNAIHGTGDASDVGGGAAVITSETTAESTELTIATYTDRDVRRTPKHLAGFPHRDVFGRPPDAAGQPCPVRLRLTPARPYRTSSVQRLQPVPVLQGWETGFTFQLTDASQHCTHTKDAAAGTRSYRTCSVAGGDGFAFILHGDPAGSGAVGGGGGGLGYSGLRNALVLEFDTWHNAGDEGKGGVTGGASGGVGSSLAGARGGGIQSTRSGPQVGLAGAGVTDLPYDHIALQAAPVGSAAGGEGGLDGSGADGLPFVTHTAATRIAAPRVAALGDGFVHAARIVYWPYLKMDLVPFFSVTGQALQYMIEGGEGRRMGTLAVYLDAAASNASLAAAPTLAVPINLNSALRLPGDQAWVGFTAATGRAWQKHDVLSWYWCDAPGCPRALAVREQVLHFNTTGAVPPAPGRR